MAALCGGSPRIIAPTESGVHIVVAVFHQVSNNIQMSMLTGKSHGIVAAGVLHTIRIVTIRIVTINIGTNNIGTIPKINFGTLRNGHLNTLKISSSRSRNETVIGGIVHYGNEG